MKSPRLLLAAGAAAGLTLGAPASASAQSGLLGTIGSVVGGVTAPVTSTLDQLLGGATTVLPSDTLGDVITNVLAPAGAPGAPGAPGAGGAAGAPGAPAGGDVRVVAGSSTPASGAPAAGVGIGGGADDRRAPLATVRVVSRLSAVARTRRLRVAVSSDEPGVVAFSSTVRPGVKRRGVARSVKHSRSVIHIPAAVLAFRRAGTLTVDLRLSAADAARLGRARNARMSVGLLTADVARNQNGERLKRALRR